MKREMSHVEQSGDGHSCRHCGGEVSEHDGMAMHMSEGGEAARMGDEGVEGWEQEERSTTEGLDTEQQNGTELMRHAAFADAIRRRGHSGGAMKLSQGGVAEPKKTAPGTDTSTATEVRSPTSTSTDAYTQGNVTVTGGAGAGATSVHIGAAEKEEKKKNSYWASRSKGGG